MAQIQFILVFARAAATATTAYRMHIVERIPMAKMWFDLNSQVRPSIRLYLIKLAFVAATMANYFVRRHSRIVMLEQPSQWQNIQNNSMVIYSVRSHKLLVSHAVFEWRHQKLNPWMYARWPVRKLRWPISTAPTNPNACGMMPLWPRVHPSACTWKETKRTCAVEFTLLCPVFVFLNVEIASIRSDAQHCPNTYIYHNRQICDVHFEFHVEFNWMVLCRCGDGCSLCTVEYLVVAIFTLAHRNLFVFIGTQKICVPQNCGRNVWYELQMKTKHVDIDY